jgi:hypothetical protein
MKILFKPTAAAVLTLVASSSFAQQVAADGTVTMPPVTVTGVADNG